VIEWRESFGFMQQEGEEAQSYGARLPLVGQVQAEFDRTHNGWVASIGGRRFGPYKTSDEAKAKVTAKVRDAANELLTILG
jgi:hypothetical protein